MWKILTSPEKLVYLRLGCLLKNLVLQRQPTTYINTDMAEITPSSSRIDLLISSLQELNNVKNKFINQDNIIEELTNLRLTTKYVFDSTLQMSVNLFEIKATSLAGCTEESLSMLQITANLCQPKDILTLISDHNTGIPHKDNLRFFEL